MEKQNFH